MQLDQIRHFCLSLPEAKENLQWGENLCFKIRGKLFAVVGLGAVPQSLTLKSHPERFAELLECEGVVLAPYVGRYKWIKIERLDAFAADELEALIQQSYDLVAAKAAKKPGTRKRARRARRK